MSQYDPDEPDRTVEFGDAQVDGGSAAPAVLQRLSNDLITQVLRAKDYRYFTDSDGDVGADWDNIRIYFFMMGKQKEILNVRSYFEPTFGIDMVPRLYEFCNDWNRRKLWPKAYVHVKDDGTAIILGEVITDFEFGVTFDQISQIMTCGIACSWELEEEIAQL